MATIRKRRGKWQVQVRRQGNRPISRSFSVRKDAETWARQIEVQADRFELPANPKILERVTLGELVKRYRDTVTTNKRGHEPEAIVLTALLSHWICRRRLSELRTADFAAYRDERLQSIKPATLRRQLAPVHNLFKVARDEWGLPIKENPLDKLSVEGDGARRERRLKAGELERLIEAARTRRNRCIVPIIMVAVETGMRRGEILAMRWTDFDAGTKSLPIPQTKNGHSRIIPLSGKAAEVLNAVPRIGERVFPITANAFRLAWERVKRTAHIDDLHFHDLRHEAVSRFFELGLTMPEVALVSGHRDMRMLFRYTHPMREAIAAKIG